MLLAHRFTSVPRPKASTFSEERSRRDYGINLSVDPTAHLRGDTIEAEPARIQDLRQELPGMELEGSVIKMVHAVTGRYDLIAFVESPDLQSLGN